MRLLLHVSFSGLLTCETHLHIPQAEQLDVPQVSHKGLLVMVHQLESGDLQVTLLNFSNEAVPAVVTSERLPAKATVINMITNTEVAVVDQLGSFPLKIKAYQGMALLIHENKKSTPEE